MRSSEENPRVIDEYLARELEWGRVLGPLAPEVSQAVHINCFGIIPKSQLEGKGVATMMLSCHFVLCSAPKIFNAVADGLQWILGEVGVEGLHYLDNYIIFGAPHTQECRQALDRALGLCKRLDVPIAAHKTEGPATVIQFLGIELDSGAMEARLTQGNC